MFVCAFVGKCVCVSKCVCLSVCVCVCVCECVQVCVLDMPSLCHEREGVCVFVVCVKERVCVCVRHGRRVYVMSCLCDGISTSCLPYVMPSVRLPRLKGA